MDRLTRRFGAILILILVICSGCTAEQALATETPTQAPTTPQNTITTLPTPGASLTITPTVTTTPLASISISAITAAPLSPGAASATQEWQYYPAGEITAPILMYHHIEDSPDNNRYYVSPDHFKAQMEFLAKAGYQTISTSQLADVIRNGGLLPKRPVIITFDDGSLSVFQTAYPIMQQYGFKGVAYIITSWVNADQRMTKAQLSTLATKGWEIGCHSMTHQDLTGPTVDLKGEIQTARENLEAMLGTPVTSFAYPFTSANDFIGNKVRSYGYNSAVGAGAFDTHSEWSLYFLSRREVRWSYDLDAFKALLPWSD